MGMEPGLDAEAFRDAFGTMIVSHCDAAWTLFAETVRGFLPVGLVLGVWPNVNARVMNVADIVWCPWASVRNQIESTVGFFNTMRNEIPMMGFVRSDHRRMYEVCCQHGIMRRIGTSHNVFVDEPAAVFETRVKE